MSKWATIVQVFDNTGKPHCQWPNPIGQSLRGATRGRSTARYIKAFRAFEQHITAGECSAAFYIQEEGVFKLLTFCICDKSKVVLPESINPSDADIIDTSEEYS